MIVFYYVMSFWLMKFCVVSLMMKMNVSVSIVLIFGRWKLSICLGCYDLGSRSSVWFIVLMMRLSIYSVIVSGMRISRLVRNIVFRVVFFIICC